MSHRQLTESQRYQIYALLKLDLSRRQIADVIDVHHTTVSRELRRNHVSRHYNPDLAQGATDVRRTFSRKARIITLEIENLIIFFLKFGYSPSMICHILEYSHGIKIAFQTIYNHIETDRKHGGELYKLLPFKGRARRSDYQYKPWKHGTAPGQYIDQRPVSADNRSRFGHLEIDTIVSKDRKGGVLTVVDRKSRFLWAKIIPNMNASTVKKALVELLDPIKDQVKTITSDNGREFSEHHAISKALDCQFYFCRPYSSFERGTVERMNREIRSLYPKKTDFHKIDKDLFQVHIDLINFKPRSCLDMKSPHSTFYKTDEFWRQNKVVQLLLESRVFT